MIGDDAGGGTFEVLEHTADIGFRAEAASPRALFETCVRALLHVAIEDADIATRGRTTIEVRSDDQPSLLVDVLNEVLYLFDAGRWAPAGVSVEAVDARSARVALDGEPRDPARHPWKLIVKAVTYHGLEVAERNGRWHARVFLDV